MCSIKFKEHPYTMHKANDYKLSLGSLGILLILNKINWLPQCVSLSITYTITYGIIFPQLFTYIQRGNLTGLTIDKSIDDCVNIITKIYCEVFRSDCNDKVIPISSEVKISKSRSFEVLRNLSIMSAYHYWRCSQSNIVGLAAVIGVSMTLESMQRILDGYEYMVSTDSKPANMSSNLINIIEHSFFKACANTAIHLCIMTIWNDQTHLVSQVVSLPYVHVLQKLLEYGVNYIFNSNSETSECRVK